MAYISSDGRVIQRRPWSIDAVLAYFWGVVGFFVFFFRGLFHMDEPSSRGQYGRPGQQQRHVGNPGRRMGGFKSSGGPSAPPCAPGGG